MVHRIILRILACIITVVLLFLWLVSSDKNLENPYWIIPILFGVVLCLIWLKGLSKFSNTIGRRIEYLQGGLFRELSLRSETYKTENLRYGLERNRRKIEKWLVNGISQKTRRKQVRTARELERGWDKIISLIERPDVDPISVNFFGRKIDHTLHHMLHSVFTLQSTNVVLELDHRKNALKIFDDLDPGSIDKQRHSQNEKSLIEIGLVSSVDELQIKPCQLQSLCVYDSKEVINTVEAGWPTVSLEKGVYRIREDMFSKQQSLNCSSNQESDGGPIDRGIPELSSFDSLSKHQIRVTNQGLMYDKVLNQVTETGSCSPRITALQQSSSLLFAEGAALLFRDEKSALYHTVAAVGILSGYEDSCVIASGTPLYEDLCGKNRYLFSDVLAHDFVLFTTAIGLLNYTIYRLKRIILLPAVVSGKSAYLLFVSNKAQGQQKNSDFEWSLHNIATLLNLYV